MSFSITTQQYRDHIKTVTRRLGWWHVKPGDICNGVEKAMGLKKGEKMNVLGQHQFLSARPEPLRRMTDDLEYGQREVVLEGFPDLTPAQFVEMFCRTHKGCTPDTAINRLEYKYL